MITQWMIFHTTKNTIVWELGPSTAYPRTYEVKKATLLLTSIPHKKRWPLLVKPAGKFRKREVVGKRALWNQLWRDRSTTKTFVRMVWEKFLTFHIVHFCHLKKQLLHSNMFGKIKTGNCDKPEYLNSVDYWTFVDILAIKYIANLKTRILHCTFTSNQFCKEKELFLTCALHTSNVAWNRTDQCNLSDTGCEIAI